MNQITLTAANSGAPLQQVVNLCWAYRDFLTATAGVSADVTAGFHPDTRYQALMDHLPALHARPTGIILLAQDTDGTPLGCGMSHPLDAQTSEIKRLYVTDAARSTGIATYLCETLLAQARHDGFRRAVLDTHRELHAAQRLYSRLGFQRRGPYQPMPEAILPELVFYEKSLTTD